MLSVAKRKSEPAGFGARLRAFREAAGLTQKELAAAAGLGRLSVIRYEAGETEPSWSVVCRLAEAIGKTPDAFLGDPDG